MGKNKKIIITEFVLKHLLNINFNNSLKKKSLFAINGK